VCSSRMLTSDPYHSRRDFEEIEEAARIEFSEIREDSKEQVKRAKLAVLRRLHQHENFKALLECGNFYSMILRNPSFNRGTAFTREERDSLAIRGLLPPHVETLEEQCSQIIDFLDALQDDLQKYLLLVNLSERNETVFYKILCDYPQKYVPVVAASRLAEKYHQFSHLWMFQKGMFLSLYEKGILRRILDNWIFPKVDVIVVTDGSRVPGFGDLGCNAMCRSTEKLMLYVAEGGFHPARTLPIVLDVGTSNEELRDHDRYYLGMRIHRVEDSVYYPFVDEFMEAIQDKWPHAVVQFQDFSEEHAYSLLERYKERFLCFNDDIQGIAVVALAGLLNACRLTGTKLSEQRFLFLGAGNVALGIANYLVREVIETDSSGISEKEAKKAIWMADREGVLTRSREKTLSEDKIAYVREDWMEKGAYISLPDIIEQVRPTVLIGTTNKKNLFDEEVLRKMAEIQDRPIILTFSRSNGDSECSFEEVNRKSGHSSSFLFLSSFFLFHTLGYQLFRRSMYFHK
jgi:malate dehydrogenase (oxaloacetate-decarboxylating)(NADP+)